MDHARWKKHVVKDQANHPAKVENPSIFHHTSYLFHFTFHLLLC